jgi:hypothetical protein
MTALVLSGLLAMGIDVLLAINAHFIRMVAPNRIETLITIVCACWTYFVFLVLCIKYFKGN